MFGIKTRIKKFLGIRTTLQKNYHILRDDYGQKKSCAAEQCLDARGNKVPWFTYPAIEYLNQIDLSGLSVLEYGSGNSTFYWAGRAGKVVSIEDWKPWYEKLKPQLPANVEYIHAGTKEEYVGAVQRLAGPFDIIVNDGLYRYDCGVASRPRLAEGGFIILDNSDWCPRTCAFYRESDLIEIDMAGFTPLNAYTMTTSLFLTRSFRPRPASDRQPTLAVGGEPVTDKELSEWIQG